MKDDRERMICSPFFPRTGEARFLAEEMGPANERGWHGAVLRLEVNGELVGGPFPSVVKFVADPKADEETESRCPIPFPTLADSSPGPHPSSGPGPQS